MCKVCLQQDTAENLFRKLIITRLLIEVDDKLIIEFSKYYFIDHLIICYNGKIVNNDYIPCVCIKNFEILSMNKRRKLKKSKIKNFKEDMMRQYGINYRKKQ